MTTPTFISQRPPHLYAFILVALAVALRLSLGLAHPFLLPDSHDYDTLARTLLEQHAYIADGHLAFRMPGYPIFVALVYALSNNSLHALLIVQSLLGGAIVWLVYLLVRRTNQNAAFLAAALTALDPLSIAFSASLLTEIPFTFLLMFCLWQAMSLAHRPSWYRWVILGLIWALGVYVRASALWCLLPLGIILCFHPNLRRAPIRALAGAALAVAIVLALLLPWQIRNYNLFHSGFSRLTTLEGISLYEAVYPDADGGPKQDIISLPPEMRQLDEAQCNDEWSRRAWHYVFSDPARILSLAIKKIGRTWSPILNDPEYAKDAALQFGLAFWHIPLFIFALVGLFSPLMPLKIKGPLLVPVVYFTLVHALYLGSVRYRVPLMPILCIFAAVGFIDILQRMRNTKPDRSSAV